MDRATDGQTALDRLRGATYDLIVNDVRMPEMDGPALYRELERHMGAMTSRFIFVTGDVLTPETQEFVRRPGVPTVGNVCGIRLGAVRACVLGLLGPRLGPTGGRGAAASPRVSS